MWFGANIAICENLGQIRYKYNIFCHWFLLYSRSKSSKFDLDGEWSNTHGQKSITRILILGEYYTNLEEMAEGEGFQIVQWDVINAKKRVKKGEDYENSGTVILKSIKIDQAGFALTFLFPQTIFQM